LRQNSVEYQKPMEENQELFLEDFLDQRFTFQT